MLGHGQIHRSSRPTIIINLIIVVASYALNYGIQLMKYTAVTSGKAFYWCKFHPMWNQLINQREQYKFSSWDQQHSKNLDAASPLNTLDQTSNVDV